MPQLNSSAFVEGFIDGEKSQDPMGIDEMTGEVEQPKEQTLSHLENGGKVCHEDLFKKQHLTATMKFLLFFVAFGSIMMGMDQGILATIEVFAMPDLNLNDNQWSYIASAFSLATAVGTVFAIPIGEYLGRKRALQISAAICFGGSVMQTAAKNFSVLLGGRYLLGIGMGLEAMNIPIYVAECAPAHGRGGHLSIFNWFQMAGSPTAYVVASIFIQVKPIWKWRFMAGAEFLAGLIQFCGLLILPESPRWLIMWKKEKQLVSSWSRLRFDNAISRFELEKMRDDVEDDLKNRTTYSDAIKLIFTNRRVRTPFYIGAVLGMSSQFSGATAIGYYMITILEKLGLTVTTSVYALLPINFWSTCWAGLPFFLLDRVGRRPLLMYTFPPQIIAIILSLTSFYVPLSKLSERAELYLIGLLLYGAFNNIGISAIQWVMAGELYETEVRSIGAAWSAFWIFASAFVTTFTFSRQVDAIGVKGVYGLYTGFTAFFMVVLFFIFPETKGRTLEEVKEVMNSGIQGIMERNVAKGIQVIRNVMTRLKSKNDEYHTYVVEQ
ncbi:MFS transporter, SP family, sugar:H+ symporter [Galdieria sulphuraria]|uniref:MFS transporter, SP family, sugar:H+ symporter n=1 Tax=Galdieria sulphuraria TaxID=130081 RepID=M2WWA9_GALSU|nr:MFS transporter, SP family, sugar:H+ symporter [Galdieria sulphuraria]EME28295.1 MFS transporter, SP family, sugar:H+ symporter [Galdieria sulphuraria]|eukprot:XP_005704815.1 MFS transporter, SP family, sugar:H+ symporter [Galdieria sulphuraria]